MQTMDNSVPEVERLYSVKLIGLTGDGRLGTTTTSRVTSELSIFIMLSSTIIVRYKYIFSQLFRYLSCILKVRGSFLLKYEAEAVHLTFSF